MRMDYFVVIFGGLLVFFTVAFGVAGLPVSTFNPEPSPDARPYTASELRGRHIYIQNGCLYCHSQFARPQDYNVGAGRGALRPSRPGDFAFDRPHLLGTERTGPDLSHEAGNHPDDWHIAHFNNPRFTRPKSIMPRFDWLSDSELRDLTSYVQSLGDEEDFAELARVRKLSEERLNRSFEDFTRTFLFEAGSENISNPVPATARSIESGGVIYRQNCIGCHGPKGDGTGPAAVYLSPTPFDLTSPRFAAMTDGFVYWVINKGVAGTAMEPFEDSLAPIDLWNVINYLRTFLAPEAEKAGEELRKIEERDRAKRQLEELQKRFGAEP